MDAKAHDLNFVLGQKQHWVVPVYQRHYEWESAPDKQIPKLWEDLRDKAIERLEDRTPFPHYIGTIIYSEPPKQAFGSTPRIYLVDGQQRITTFHIILAALREVAREQGTEQLVDVAKTYLFNEKSNGMIDPERERFKLWPSVHDRTLFQMLSVDTPDEIRKAHTPRYFYKNGKLKTGQAPNLLRAYWYFHRAFSDFIEDRSEYDENSETVLHALIAGFLSGFQVVVIQLDQNDDAQEIFASLNGLGKPLSPFDLIRNDVFHRARKTGEDDEQLFDDQWKSFEEPFWSEHVRQGRFKRARADHLIAHAVVAETARDVNVGKIATEYQHYARERAFDTVAEELDVLLSHARNYRRIDEQDSEIDIGRIAQILRIWDLSTLHPVLLWIASYVGETEDRERLFCLLESYVVRREICGLSTKNYNKVATSFIRAMRNSDQPVEGFVSHLGTFTGDISRMPTDAQLAEAFAHQTAYGGIPTARLRYIFLQIEYELRDKFDEVTVSTANLTIEHVMPRKWSEHWPHPNGKTATHKSSFSAFLAGEELDEETKSLTDARSRAIDTFGNLTLVTEALNPSMGKNSWASKKVRLAGSLLTLNRTIAQQDSWNEKTIESRASDLANVAAKRWAGIDPN